MTAINWTQKATKQLRKLDRQQQVAIRDGIGRLAAIPECWEVKSLTHHQYGYRLRVGNHRVLFNWDGAINVVEMEEIRTRDEGTG